MPSVPRVLVVEDDAAIRCLLRVALERDGYAAIETVDARGALSAIDIDKPDAVLLDLGLPDRDGLELIQLIKARGDAVLLVVSARVDTAEKVAALDLGADDYLTKPFDTEEMLARLRTALRRRRASEGERQVIVADAVTIDLVHRRVLRSGAEVHLTPKEYDVLAELARRPDRVIGHTQLLRTIWGPGARAPRRISAHRGARAAPEARAGCRAAGADRQRARRRLSSGRRPRRPIVRRVVRARARTPPRTSPASAGACWCCSASNDSYRSIFGRRACDVRQDARTWPWEASRRAP